MNRKIRQAVEAEYGEPFWLDRGLTLEQALEPGARYVRADNRRHWWRRAA